MSSPRSFIHCTVKRRQLALRLAGAVAGHLRERGVDGNYLKLGVGDHCRLAGCFDDLGRQPQVFLCATALGNFLGQFARPLRDPFFHLAVRMTERLHGPHAIGDIAGLNDQQAVGGTGGSRDHPDLRIYDSLPRPQDLEMHRVFPRRRTTQQHPRCFTVVSVDKIRKLPADYALRRASADQPVASGVDEFDAPRAT